MTKITPRDYQQAAIDAGINYLWTQPQGAGLILAPTGTGKSIIIAGLVEEIKRRHFPARVVMLTHVKELVEQNYEKICAMTDLRVGIWSAGLGKKDYHCDIVFAGIDTVARNALNLGSRDVMIIDEAHRVSPDPATNYQKTLHAIRTMNPNASALGLTATDYRLGQGLLTDEWYCKKTKEFIAPFWKDVIIDMTSMDNFNWFIQNGYLKRLVPRPTNAEIDVSTMRVRGGEYLQADVEKVVNNERKICTIVDEICDMGIDRRSWLVFGAGNRNAELIAAELTRRGVSCAVLSESTPKSERKQIIKDYKAYKIRCLVNNDILTTGFDHAGVDLIAVVRVTMSTALWCLSDDTEILTEQGWMTKDEVKKSMATVQCASVDAKTLEFKYTPILDYIERPLHANEQMVTVDLPRANFCVSDNHRMLVSKPVGRAKLRTAPYFCKAFKLCDESRIDIPVSAVNLSPRTTGLSNDELTFLGIYMADGTIDKSNNRMEIRQSDRYPEVQCEIERLICTLGLHATVRHRTAKEVNERSNFSTRYGSKAYRIAYRRKDTQGWARFTNFVDKEISDALLNCNREEFTSFLRGLNLGDGCKYASPTWTRGTMDIAVGINKRTADRLQIMCIKNGYSCSIADNSQGCIMLRIKDMQWKSLCKPYGKDTRNSVKMLDTYDGNVWCIENADGTLITRRAGKVTIMGNCQMLGRGTRPVYAHGFDLESVSGRLSAIIASGVHNCLVLDFAGNSKRLGAINAPVKPSPRGRPARGGGDAPVKLCAVCGTMSPSVVKVCEFCGTEFPLSKQITDTASTRELIVEKEHVPDMRKLQVTSVRYIKQEIGYGSGMSSSVRAEYSCGKNGTFHERLTFAGGKSTKKTKSWWQAFGDGTAIPASNADFLQYYAHSRVKKPMLIEVYLNNPKKEKPEITYYGFEDTSYFDASSDLSDE